MAHYGPIYVYEWVWVLFGLGDTSLEWGLVARLFLEVLAMAHYGPKYV